MKRILLIAALCLFNIPAKAMTVIDLFESPQINGPYLVVGPCYCSNGYATGYFDVTPGDTVNFGVLTVGTTWMHSHYPDRYGNIPPPSPALFSMEVSYDPTKSPSWVSFVGFGGSTTYDLTNYLIPDDVEYINFRWLGPLTYNAPESVAAVPELSTWAMLLIGFAVIAAFRRGVRLTDPMVPVSDRVI